jgi:hypothetical protein
MSVEEKNLILWSSAILNIEPDNNSDQRSEDSKAARLISVREVSISDLPWKKIYYLRLEKELSPSIKGDSTQIWPSDEMQETAKPTVSDRKCFVTLNLGKLSVWCVDTSYGWHYGFNDTLWLPDTRKHNIVYNLSQGLETRLYLLILTASLRGTYTTRPRYIIN